MIVYVFIMVTIVYYSLECFNFINLFLQKRNSVCSRFLCGVFYFRSENSVKFRAGAFALPT